MGVEDDLRKTEVRKEKEVRVIETSRKERVLLFSGSMENLILG
jgi:hypothetical protein